VAIGLTILPVVVPSVIVISTVTSLDVTVLSVTPTGSWPVSSDMEYSVWFNDNIASVGKDSDGC